MKTEQTTIITYKGSEMGYPVGRSMREALEYIDSVIPHLVKIIKDKRINIWCRGSSGAILSALVAAKIPNNCEICHVKKEGEDSHLGNYFSRGELEGGINIIIDDFSCTGSTVHSIYEKMVTSTVDILILSRIHSDVHLQFLPKYIITAKVFEESAKNSLKTKQQENEEANKISF